MNHREDVLIPISGDFDEWKDRVLEQIQRMICLHLKQSCGFEPIFKDNRDLMKEYILYLAHYIRLGWAQEE